MRKEKILIKLLHGLTKVLAEEADRNPEFARKIEDLLTTLSQVPERPKPNRRESRNVELPDIYSEWHARGEEEFRLWLRDRSLEALQGLIKHHDFDPSRRTSRWKEREKLSSFIADQLRGRLSRGSRFMRS
jgi:hypothetical protein